MLGAIQGDSYGYQTFFANRVGEIQKARPVEDWWWILGDVSIADIITRGAAPKDIEEGTAWQSGPEFLRWPVKEWPIKSAKEVAADARESINQIQKKAFSAVVTRAQSFLQGNSKTEDKVLSRDDPTQAILCTECPEYGEVLKRGKASQGRKPDGSVVKFLVDVKHLSSLPKLVV